MTAERTERPLENIVMLPCPFCGGEATERKHTTSDNYYQTGWEIFCSSCPAEMYVTVPYIGGGDYDATDDNIKACLVAVLERWNRRKHNAAVEARR
jgi:hypothetical protein